MGIHVSAKLVVSGPSLHFLVLVRDGTKRRCGPIKEFQGRVDNYLSAKKKQDIAKKPTDSPGKLAEEKQQTTKKTSRPRVRKRTGEISLRQRLRPISKSRLRRHVAGAGGTKSVPACGMPSRCRMCN